MTFPTITDVTTIEDLAFFKCVPEDSDSSKYSDNHRSG